MTSGNGSGDLELLRAEIRHTRADLGQTVQALAARADVPARMRQSAVRTGQRVRDQAGQAVSAVRNTGVRQELPVAVIAAGAVVALIAWWMIRGRSG